MENVYWMCILLACSIILLSVFVYRVLINYKKYCEEQNWMNALFYILSIIFSSVIAGMFLIKPAIGLVHNIWITL
jgi:putative effector of murein hydrolase